MEGDAHQAECCPVEPERSCPKNLNDEVCSGNGECMEDGRGFKCTCKEGFSPPACLNTTELRNVNEQREEKFENVKKARDYLKERRMKCNQTFPVLCLSDDNVPAELQNTCQEVMLDCYGGNRTVLRDIRDKRREQCGANEQFCDVDGCIRKTIPCTVVSHECPAVRPRRCPDWKCQKQDAECVDGGDVCTAPTKTLCADGVTCAENLRACAELGIQWNGCGDGEVECPGRKHFCAANETMCERQGACGAGLRFCGVRRNGQGKQVFRDGKAVPICKATCAAEQPTPETALAEFGRGRAVRELIARSADGVVAVVLSTETAEAFARADNGTAGVNFTVGPVASSLVQNGPFRKYFNAGTMMSQPVLIEPSAEVVINGGFVLEFVVVDDSIVNETMCLRVLSGLSVVTVTDMTRFDAEVELVATCQRGKLDNCSCAVNLTHFSAYTVVDDDGQRQAETAATAAAGSNATTTAANDTTTAAGTTTAANNDTTTAAGTTTAANNDTTTAAGTTTAANNATTTANEATAAGNATTTAAGNDATPAPTAGNGTVEDADTTTAAAPDTTAAAPDTTAATTATFALEVTSTLTGVTAEELRANLGGFREAVAAVHAREAADVEVDEDSIQTVTVRRRRLLADGVSVSYQVKGFADQAAAAAAKEVQETAGELLTTNLKSNGFTNVEAVESTVTVLDSSGLVIDGAATRPAAAPLLAMAAVLFALLV